jgi:hypothetical protein
LIAHKGIDAQGKAKHRSCAEQTVLYDSFFDLVNNSSSGNSSTSSSSSSSSSTKLLLRSLDIDETFIYSGVLKSAIIPRIFATFPESTQHDMVLCIY